MNVSKLLDNDVLSQYEDLKQPKFKNIIWFLKFYLFVKFANSWRPIFLAHLLIHCEAHCSNTINTPN